MSEPIVPPSYTTPADPEVDVPAPVVAPDVVADKPPLLSESSADTVKPVSLSEKIDQVEEVEVQNPLHLSLCFVF